MTKVIATLQALAMVIIMDRRHRVSVRRVWEARMYILRGLGIGVVLGVDCSEAVWALAYAG